MYPKITDVKTEDEYILIVTFDNKKVKKIDLSPRLFNSRFQALQNKVMFKNATIDQGGYGISWNDDIDMSEYELWNEAELLN